MPTAFTAESLDEMSYKNITRKKNIKKLREIR